MNNYTDLKPVIDNSYCIACGACAAADSSIEIVLDPKKLMYQPSHPGDERAASVCPSIAVDFEELQQKLFPQQPITPVGVVQSIRIAQSTNFERNNSASSGGLIKEILLELITKEDVDGIIALTHIEGLDFAPTLIRDEGQIDTLPGSIYHNISFARALEILRSEEGRFVLVAIPCQLEGIFNYIFKLDPALREKIHTTVGLICGWTYTHHSIEAIAELKGHGDASIQDISFRGGGPVGPLRIVFEDDTLEVNRRKDFDYITAFDRSFNTPRCHLCVNHINYLADIVVGDAWLQSVSDTATGVSIIISRTESAQELINSLEEKGRIITADASEEEILESQGRRFTYGDFAYAYARHLRSEGKFTIEMVGPNRSEAQLEPERIVRQEHKEMNKKIKMQQAGKYKALRQRKLLVDTQRYFVRFVTKRIKNLIQKLANHTQNDAIDDLQHFR